MSVVGAAVILGLIVVLLIKWKIVRPVACIVCVLFGLVLGATPIGDTVNAYLTQLGRWVTSQFRGL